MVNDHDKNLLLYIMQLIWLWLMGRNPAELPVEIGMVMR